MDGETPCAAHYIRFTFAWCSDQTTAGTLWSRGWGRDLAAVFAGRGDVVDEALQHLDRQREDDGAVLLGGDLGQGLQVAQLQGGRLAADDLGRVGELLAGAELAFGVDDLGPLLALGLGLARHGP